MTTVNLPDWLADMTVADVVGFVLILVALYVILRKVFPVSGRLVHLIDDLAGEAARPGVPARPGLMERVASVELAVREVREKVVVVDGRLDVVEFATAQLLPNNGSHLADAVNRVEKTQREEQVRAGRPVAPIPPPAHPAVPHEN